MQEEELNIGMGKKEIIQVIYNVLSEELNLDIEKIGLTDDLTEIKVGWFRIHTDDWSFDFIPEIEKKFGCSFSIEEWGRINFTIDNIAEMIHTRLCDRPGKSET